MKRVVKTIGTLGLVGCAAMNSPFAIAEDSGWYIGGNIGQSRATIDDARITSNLLGGGFTTTSIVDDNRDSGYKLFGGYQFNENLALEAGYFDLGQFGYTANVATVLAGTPGTLTGRIRLKGVNIDAIGILPISEQFSVFGRVGLNYAQARDNFTGTGSANVLNPNPSKSDTNYKFGLGLQFNFTEALAMRLEAERYRIDDAVGNKGDIDLLSLGLTYKFGVEKPVPVARMAEPEPVAAAPAAPKPTIAPPPPVSRKAVFSADSSADALFSFGKADIKPGGERALDKFAADLKGANYEVITVTGHTDRLGPQAYNLKLSTQRAEAVKNYLIEYAGIPSDKIEAKGVNGANPVTKPGECVGTKATAELKACLAPDRRVEVEVSATRTVK
ncbi:MAG: OmpA family protein [Gallionella sp.]|nr:OmpA family protein [Gallionella sp.]